MELDNALSQIAQIHRQMSRTRMFRGYRAATTLCTGITAIVAAMFQAVWIPNPAAQPLRFIDLWSCVAIASLFVVGAEVTLRYRRCDSLVQRELTTQAVEQFLPCVIVGGLVTLILGNDVRFAWMLPGLWEIFFGLGMFASRRLLPGALVFVGAFYLLCGLAYLAVAADGGALSLWSMGLPFGIGQVAAAAILRWNLERKDDAINIAGDQA